MRTVDVDTRARQSRGTSNAAIYKMVRRVLEARAIPGGRIVDVGCGEGSLRSFVEGLFLQYVGIDAVKYEAYPEGVEFYGIDLDTGRAPLADGFADAVVAVETIEHLENPRAFMRELNRLATDGGWIVVTTPNQTSLLSLINLAIRGTFVAFKEENYPAHMTALLPIDLVRIAGECGMSDVEVAYSHEGRMPFVRHHYPRFLSRRFPRALSDNVLVIGRKGHA